MISCAVNIHESKIPATVKVPPMIAQIWNCKQKIDYMQVCYKEFDWSRKPWP